MRYALKNYKWFFAITLSLVLGLGSVIASAHTHFDSEHQNSSCELCVLPTIASVASIDTAIDHPPVSPVAAIQIDLSIPCAAVQSNNLARAPPKHL
jgi:hypothetical protein